MESDGNSHLFSPADASSTRRQKAASSSSASVRRSHSMPTRSQVRVMRTLHLDAIPELAEDADEGLESQSQTSHKRKSSGSSSGSSKRTKDLEPEEEGNLYNEWTRLGGGENESKHTEVASQPRLDAWNFEDTDFVLNGEDILFDRKLGEGYFGVVFKGVWQGLDVAVKKLKEGVHLGEIENFRKEVSVMCKLRHPNVVTFYGVTKPPSPMIVSQLMHCSLFDILHKSNEVLDTEVKLRILRDIACGAHYLHSRKPPIVHRDLSSVNVLVTGDIHWLRALTQAKKLEPLAKLNDFGLSRQVEWYMTAGCGNFYYIAPEVFRGERYDTKADVYSFAVLTWELFTQRRPFADMNPQSAAYHVAVNGLRPEFPDDFPTPVRNMVEACWARSPLARPSFQRIFSDLSMWLGLTSGRVAGSGGAGGSDSSGSEPTPMIRSTTIVPSVQAHMLSQGVAPPAPGNVMMPPPARPRPQVPVFESSSPHTTQERPSSARTNTSNELGSPQPSPSSRNSQQFAVPDQYDLPDYESPEEDDGTDGEGKQAMHLSYSSAGFSQEDEKPMSMPGF